jgi:hypothetical protein
MPVTKSDLLSDDVGTRQNDGISYRECKPWHWFCLLLKLRMDTILAATWLANAQSN